MEELEQAMKKYNMGDDKSIKEIIAEVDTDRVCITLHYLVLVHFIYLLWHYHLFFLNILLTSLGRKNQLRRICSDDEEGKPRIGDKPTQSQYVKRWEG